MVYLLGPFFRRKKKEICAMIKMFQLAEAEKGGVHRQLKRISEQTLLRK